MEKFLGQDIPENERWQFLQDNADAVEEIGYTHRFSPEELAQKKELLAEASIKINDIEEEKKEALSDFKDRLKPLTEEKAELLENIKTGSKFIPSEKCVKILYHEEKNGRILQPTWRAGLFTPYHAAGNAENSI